MGWYLAGYFSVSAALLFIGRRALLVGMAATVLTVLIKSVAWLVLPAVATEGLKSILAAPIEEGVRGFIGATFSNDTLAAALCIAVFFAAVENWPIFETLVSISQIWDISSFNTYFTATSSEPVTAWLYLLQPFARIGLHFGLAYISIEAVRRRCWVMLLGLIVAHGGLNGALTLLADADRQLLAGLLFTTSAFAVVMAALWLHRQRSQNIIGVQR